MKKTEALDFCSHWLAAWTGNSPEKLASFYSKDAYYQDPARPTGLYGQSELVAYFQKLLAKHPDWEWKAHEVFPHDNGFILKWKARLNSHSKEYFYGLDIVEIENGKIKRNEVYFDPKPLIG